MTPYDDVDLGLERAPPAVHEGDLVVVVVARKVDKIAVCRDALQGHLLDGTPDRLGPALRLFVGRGGGPLLPGRGPGLTGDRLHGARGGG